MKKLTNEEFIERARNAHGDKYDYSKVDYKNNKTRVCIICPIHGEFWQFPTNHLNGSGCDKCASDALVKKTEDFVKDAIQIHGNKYDYSKVNYKGNKIRVCITCPIHGDFLQTPNDHLDGCGCDKCGRERTTNAKILKMDKFIERAKKVHGDKYDYSNTDLECRDEKGRISIICPIHGEFSITPNNHLNGHGCPMCKDSKYEQNVSRFLKENKISFIHKKHFSWLGKQHLDFYLPEHNIAIECQGIQHFEPTDFGGYGMEKATIQFENGKERDIEKYIKCQKHNIPIFYYFDIEKYFGSYKIEAHNEKELSKLLIK